MFDFVHFGVPLVQVFIVIVQMGLGPIAEVLDGFPCLFQVRLLVRQHVLNAALLSMPY